MAGTNLFIRPAVTGDAADLSRRLRFSDRREIRAATGREPRPVMREAVGLSAVCRAAVMNGRCIALWGVADMEGRPGVGVPWLLMSTEAERRPATLTREARAFVGRALSVWPVLVNWVDAGNVPAIRWLVRLGFDVAARSEPFGVFGLPFYRFQMRSKHV